MRLRLPKRSKIKVARPESQPAATKAPENLTVTQLIPLLDRVAHETVHR